MICGMKDKIPSISDIRGRLEPLNHAAIRSLADVSKVPFTTLLKIRSGETQNPGIETVRSFAGHIARKSAKQKAEAA
jgi:hypothetical protein